MAAELDDLLEVVPTEASRLPVEAFRGVLGEQSIRGGERTVELVPASAVTFYLDPEAVAVSSDLNEHVRGTESLDAAQKALDDAGYRTELDRE